MTTIVKCECVDGMSSKYLADRRKRNTVVLSSWLYRQGRGRVVCGGGGCWAVPKAPAEWGVGARRGHGDHGHRVLLLRAAVARLDAFSAPKTRFHNLPGGFFFFWFSFAS